MAEGVEGGQPVVVAVGEQVDNDIFPCPLLNALEPQTRHTPLIPVGDAVERGRGWAAEQVGSLGYELHARYVDHLDDGTA